MRLQGTIYNVKLFCLLISLTVVNVCELGVGLPVFIDPLSGVTFV